MKGYYDIEKGKKSIDLFTFALFHHSNVNESCNLMMFSK
jgi:hypothetical protein